MLRYGLTQSTAPATEPITLIEAKKQVEVAIGDTRHDAHLMRLVSAARRRFEERTGRQLVTATWDLYMDRFPASDDAILLPKPPLQSVTSIVYTDTSGTSQTWASSNYVVSASREPGCVRLAYGATYPAAREQPDAVRVRYVAGYGAITAIPEDAKAAMLLLVGHWFQNRTDVVVGTITAALPQAFEALAMQFMVGDEFVTYGAESSYAEAS